MNSFYKRFETLMYSTQNFFSKSRLCKGMKSLPVKLRTSFLLIAFLRIQFSRESLVNKKSVPQVLQSSFTCEWPILNTQRLLCACKLSSKQSPEAFCGSARSSVLAGTSSRYIMFEFVVNSLENVVVLDSCTRVLKTKCWVTSAEKQSSIEATKVRIY